MPAQKRAGKRLRARKPGSARVAAVALDMEEPLNEAIDAVHALRLMGYGLTELSGEVEGRALAAIAWSACQRLDAVKQIWRSLCRQ